MGCVVSRPQGECPICYNLLTDEYYMWPCGHGSYCLDCTTAMDAERVGSVIVRTFDGPVLFIDSEQILLRCPVCRTDGFLHRIFHV